MSRQEFVYLSSRSAESFPLGEYRRDCCEWDLGTPIHCNQDERILLQLNSASIPITHLTVNSTNNKFVFVDTFNGGAHSTFTMAPAYYASIALFVSAFNSGLLAAFPNKTIVLTQGTGEYKLRIYRSGGANATTIKSSLCTMGSLLGLGSISDISVDVISNALPCFYDIGPPRAIRILTPGLDLQTTDSIGAGSSINTIASIPVSVAWGQTQTYLSTHSMLLETTRRNIGSIRLQLVDDDGRPYDTSGLEWCCSISVFIV